MKEILDRGRQVAYDITICESKITQMNLFCQTEMTHEHEQVMLQGRKGKIN